MSGGKSTGVAHRALDEIIKFKTALVTDIGKFKVDVLGAIKEFSEKHNGLAAHVTAIEGITKNTAAFAASEIGKLGGTLTRHLNNVGQATNAIDVNVLALAELSKEVIGQLTQIDFILRKLHGGADALTLNETEIEQIKTDAGKWYQDLVAASFKTVREKMDADDKAYQAREAEEAQKAKEAAETAAASESEAQIIEKELLKANVQERSLASNTSGGSGSPFPEGAEIFGG